MTFLERRTSWKKVKKGSHTHVPCAYDPMKASVEEIGGFEAGHPAGADPVDFARISEARPLNSQIMLWNAGIYFKMFLHLIVSES